MKKPLIIFVVIGVIIMSLANTPWPKHNHDLKNTSCTEEKLANKLKLKWELTQDGWWQYQPAVGGDGTIYAISADNLYAIDHKDGAIKWMCDNAEFSATPAVSTDGVIYAASWNNYLCAINKDGTLKWMCYIGEGDLMSPTIGGDGTIYITADYAFYAINPDGTIKWRIETTDWFWNNAFPSPAIGDDGTIYIYGYDKFYSINPNGSVNWEVKQPLLCYKSSLAIGNDGTIYVPSWYNVYAYSAGGVLKWKSEDIVDVETPLAVGHDGAIYCAGSWFVYSINPNNGIFKWKKGEEFISPYYSWNITVDGNNRIYLCDNKGYMNILDNNGLLLDSFYCGYGCTCIIANKALYIGNRDKFCAYSGLGELYFKGFTANLVENIQHFPGEKISKEFD